MAVKFIVMALLQALVLVVAEAKADDVGPRCDALASADSEGGRKIVRFEDIDPNAAMPACDWAVQTYPNEPRYSVQLGRAYEKAGSAEAAMDSYTRAANQGSSVAAYRIGLLYVVGKGSIPKNGNTAVSWFRISADKGYAPAQIALGSLYEEGTSVKQSHDEAVRWFRAAADQGDTVGQVNLARKYATGLGVEKDETKAFALVLEAAQRNDPVGQLSVASMLLTGQGTQRDPSTAIEWLQKAAAHDLPEAQYGLGLELLKGENIQKNDAEALELFRKGAKQNNAASMLALSNLYYDGVAVPMDKRESIEWLRKAAAAGNDIARDRLKDQVAANVPEIGKRASLPEAYTAYLTVKTCYDIRKDYMIRMISEEDVAIARKAMRKIEDGSLVSKEEKDAAWKMGNEKAQDLVELAELARMLGASGYSDNINLACRAALGQLRDIAGPENAGVRKRDF